MARTLLRLALFRLSLLKLALPIVIASMLSTQALGQRSGSSPTIDQVIDPLFLVQRFDGVAISPDGSRVAWAQGIKKKDGTPSENTAIFVASLKAGAASKVRITAGLAGSSHSEHDIAWSPDGRSIAFLSDARTPGQDQLYVEPASGGPARKLTSVKGFLAYPDRKS